MIKWTFPLFWNPFRHPASKLGFLFFEEKYLKPEAYFLLGSVCESYRIFDLLCLILDFRNFLNCQPFLAIQVYFFLVLLGQMHSMRQ